MVNGGGLIRPHVLAASDPLDRRRVEELFLWSAKRFTEVAGYYIANKQIDRTFFDLDTWEEYQTTYQDEIIYLTPHFGHQAPGTGLEITNDDSYFEGELSWSCKVQVDSADCFMVMGWPVVDGQGVFGGEDWAEVDQRFKYTAGDTSLPDEPVTAVAFTNAGYMTLGNTCGVTGVNGRSYSGVLIASIGRCKILSAQLNLRKSLR